MSEVLIVALITLAFMAVVIFYEVRGYAMEEKLEKERNYHHSRLMQLYREREEIKSERKRHKVIYARLSRKIQRLKGALRAERKQPIPVAGIVIKSRNQGTTTIRTDNGTCA